MDKSARRKISAPSDELGDYYNYLADLLTLGARAAGTQNHRGDRGTNREILCRDFLNKHLPKRLQAHLGGEIFGTNDERSDQMDIIVAHDVGLSFLQNDKPQFPIEAVAAIFSAQSNLTKSKLRKELKSFGSLPPVDSEVLEFPRVKDFGKAEFRRHFPEYFIFGFDGISYDSARSILNETYGNSDSELRLPRAVIVNQRYLLTCERDERGKFITKGGTITDKHWHLRGWPLQWIQCEISKIMGWLSFMQIDYEKYQRKAFPSGVFH